MYPQQPQQQGGRMPRKETLEYLKLGLELLLLILALPWLLRELFTHPGRLSRAAAKKHVGS